MSLDQLSEKARSAEFRQYIEDLLLEICKIDTTPQSDLDALRAAESAVFDVLEREAAAFAIPGLRPKRLPIRSDMASHAFYSQPYYAVTKQRPKVSVEEAYRGRGNLLLMTDGEGPSVAINAHIDVVKPYIAPRAENGIVYGRGACDDKGPVTAMVAALKLVGQYCRSTGKSLAGNLTAMFVIDEEMGGNGSLSLACDRELKKRYDSLMVLECCSSKIHPGNRGALWYKIDAKSMGAKLNLFEASAFVIEELEKEGRSLRAESDHELFPHRPVQTCHGVIGSYGEHPSRINGRVDFDITCKGASSDRVRLRKLIADVIEYALAEYTGVYGDKTKVMDATGKPKVDHHYDLLESPSGFTVQVHGSTGHMGSILQNDGAITKMATMVRALIRSREALSAAAGSRVELHLHGNPSPENLVMEGGQGFLPTHDMPQVMRRITNAAQRGAANYIRFCGDGDDSQARDFVVSFNKLHNAAFAGRADSPEMLSAIAAAKKADMWPNESVRGWDVSCDARIFACEYPEMTVLTSGPGELVHAHADNEQARVEDIARFAEFLAHYILLQTGTIEQSSTRKALVHG